MDLLPNHHLIIVGSGDLEIKITYLINQSKSKNRIDYLGHVLPEELKKITSTAGIGLNLLEESSKSYYYSLANKFFDYLQAGIPSINMSFPVYSHYLNKYKIGETIPNLDVNQLCEKVKFISNPINYEAYYPHLKEAAEKLNWEAEEKTLLGYFKDLD
jgi:glycosyltransferase involved in cell wall biosynthesis